MTDLFDRIRDVPPGALATILVIVAFAGYVGIGLLRSRPEIQSITWCPRCHLDALHSAGRCLSCEARKRRAA